MTEFKRGDLVYLATYDQKQVEVPCPICFGQKTVRVILGDESIVQTPCDFCGLGFEAPRGYVKEYQREPKAEPVIISSVTITEGENREVKYHAERHHLTPENTFADEASALARAAVLKAQADAEDAKRSDWGRRSTTQKLSWSIGYHMREAKENRRSAEYHESRAVILKARKRDPSSLSDDSPEEK